MIKEYQKGSVRVTITNEICEFRKTPQVIVSLFIKDSLPCKYSDLIDPEVYCDLVMQHYKLFDKVNIITLGGKRIPDVSGDRVRDKIKNLHRRHVVATHFSGAK